MADLPQGFILTRHWRDTAEGCEISFWLATAAGARLVRVPAGRWSPSSQRTSARGPRRCCGAKPMSN